MLLKAISIYLFIAILITSYLAAYIASKGKTNYLKMLAVASSSVGIVLFGYLMELNSVNIEQMIFWNQFQYLTLPFIAVIWLIVGLMYTGRFKSFLSWKLVLLYIIPIITFLLRLTNDSHHIFYTSFSAVQVKGLSLLILNKGIWYYIQSIFNVALLVVNVMVYILEYRKNSNFTKVKLQKFLFASLVPYVGVFFILLNLLVIGIDYTALLFPLSVFIVIHAIIKHDFLEVKVIARESIFEDSKDAMIVLNNENRIIDYNKAAKKFFAMINIPIKDNSIKQLSDNSDVFKEAFLSKDTKQWSSTHENQIKYWEITTIQVNSRHNNTYGELKTICDITKRKILEKSLKLQATTDELSNLYNRREFLKIGNQLVEQSKRNNLPLSVLMMDIDRFKSVNDTYGHGIGDEVIQEFGSLMKSTFRKTDINCRMGGEEFAVILLYCELENAFKKAEEFRKIVESKEFTRKKIRITVSIGMTILTNEINNIEEILKKADKALYRAKNSGRNLTLSSKEEV